MTQRGDWEEDTGKKKGGEKNETPVMQASFWLQLGHDRTAKLMKVNSYFFLPCFVTENPSEHDQAIKRAFVASNKTFENVLGWLTRVLCGWSSSGSSWCDCGFAGMVGVGFKRRERVCGG